MSIASLLGVAGTIVTVAIAVLAVGIVLFSVIRHFVRKSQGKGPDCGCGDCGGNCSCCHPEPGKENGEKKS